MTIFDVPGLDEDLAFELVQQTLDRFPKLREIYDEDFVRRLARRRRGQNYLLFMLVQPESDIAGAYWSFVVDDLVVLEREGSFQCFKPKLRARDYETLEAGRSELALAARLKRLGHSVRLEEPTRNGKDCDIAADTSPTTFWEIKSILDLDAIVKDAAVAFEVQTRLRRIDEPYVLAVLSSAVERNDVAAAVRDIKRQIAAHYSANGALPKRFSSMGLVVEAAQTTSQPQGYIGTSMLGFHIFGSEHPRKIRDRIVGAIDQLPEDGAGVVVIDTTAASWVERHDVIDACFGEESLAFVNDHVINVRNSEQAAFLPSQRRRVSAVVHYTRHPRDRGESLLVIHNPFARAPLAPSVLAAPDVQQMYRVEKEPGRYLLETTPPN